MPGPGKTHGSLAGHDDGHDDDHDHDHDHDSGAGLPARLLREPADEARGRRFAWRLVLGILCVPVAVHAVALTAASTRMKPDLVRADYYEAGERHEDELAARRAGRGLGWTVALGEAAARPGAEGAGGAEGATRFEVAMASPPAGLEPGPAIARLARPGDAALDRVLVLAPAFDGAALASGGAARWTASVPALEPGRWVARIEVQGPGGPLVYERRLGSRAGAP